MFKKTLLAFGALALSSSFCFAEPMCRPADVAKNVDRIQQAIQSAKWVNGILGWQTLRRLEDASHNCRIFGIFESATSPLGMTGPGFEKLDDKFRKLRFEAVGSVDRYCSNKYCEDATCSTVGMSPVAIELATAVYHPPKELPPVPNQEEMSIKLDLFVSELEKLQEEVKAKTCKEAPPELDKEVRKTANLFFNNAAELEKLQQYGHEIDSITSEVLEPGITKYTIKAVKRPMGMVTSSATLVIKEDTRPINADGAIIYTTELIPAESEK